MPRNPENPVYPVFNEGDCVVFETHYLIDYDVWVLLLAMARVVAERGGDWSSVGVEIIIASDPKGLFKSGDPYILRKEDIWMQVKVMDDEVV